MSTYDISKSSLLSLKAEVLRKQQEIQLNKLERKVIPSTKKLPVEPKNKGLNDRLQNDAVEDEDLLKKSRLALEKKALIYEKLSAHPQEDGPNDQHYLVQFGKKNKNKSSSNNYYSSESDSDTNFDDSNYKAKNEEEEWVDYVDEFGRTRTCLRKDLHKFTNKKDESEEDIGPEPPPPEVKERNEEEELISGDMKRELLRQQWEKEEEELRNKDDIHYQDVLFAEARTHGVGYYGFSKDEQERAKQQEALKKLREETVSEQNKAQALRETREKQLAARILAAKNRKRRREGLPDLEPEPEKPPEVLPEEKIPTEEEQSKEKLMTEARKNHIRPWDKGKEGVKEHYEYTQQEWVDLKRKERPAEFAPPTTSFNRDFRGKEKDFSDTESEKRSLYFSSKSGHDRKRSHKEKDRHEHKDDELVTKYSRISKMNEIEDDFNKKREENKKGNSGRVGNVDIEHDIEAGLKFIRKQVEKKDPEDLINNFY